MCWIYSSTGLFTVAALISCALALGQEEICESGTIREDLVSQTPRLKDIVTHHQSRCNITTAKRNFQGVSLGYVTPWNNHGYDIAKWFGSKFTHISPVWLQILHNPGLKYKITGTHDIDASWIEEVKQNGVKMVPRVLFDGWAPQHLLELGESTSRDKVIKLLLNIVKKYNFDGIVLEGWMQLLGAGNMILALEFVKLLSTKMQAEGKDFILVIPPMRGSQTIFGSKHFDLLSDTVTAFSIMTYDYSGNQGQPGPTSPIHWIKESVELVVPNHEDPNRAKILLGMNFYGYQFTSNGPEAVVGNQFIELIKSLKGKMKLHKESAENFVEIKSKAQRQTIFYPSLYSVKKRLQLASELGIGIAIWELGQGLDYFYELL